MQTIKKILYLFSKQEKKRAVLLLGMTVIMAILDVMGVASILPFMAVLANPELVESNSLFNTIYNKLEFQSKQSFFFAMGILVFLMLIMSLSFKALTNFAQLRFVYMCEYSLGRRLVEGYLNQPYSWFLNRNSANLGRNILSEVSNIVGSGIMSLMTLIAQSSVVVAISLLLIIIDPILALITSALLAFLYSLIYKITNNKIKNMGEQTLQTNIKRFTILNEAFGAIKEVKVAGIEGVYINRFSQHAKNFARQHATSQIIGQFPRHVLEAVIFGGMIILILYLMAKNGGFAEALPIIALYAFAGYRLMPSIQQIYSASTQIRFVGPSLNEIYEDLKNMEAPCKSENHDLFVLKEQIYINKIEYSYPNAKKIALKKIELKIPANKTVAFVGSTGSGKTTTADIVLGLLNPQVGTLEVDRKIISDDNRRSWQENIGYVPQQIYLADDTIAANIAFGVEVEDINQNEVERAAVIASLHEFVTNELPDKYQTVVGERGVRLSGGQRQRIGIARALYKMPKLLILDEATSALDNLTEQVVMDAVHNLRNKITIILIAHRLSTVKNCDIIFYMDNGELIDKGTYAELMKNNMKFMEMANGV